MRSKQDAFGQEVYDYYQGQEGTEIVERSDGYIGISAGPAAYFASFSDWPTSQQKAIQLAHGRVLDIGCGPGRVCLYLQDRGYVVVGIDNSDLAVKTAKLRGVKDARLLSVTQASRQTLGIFDTIVMLGNGFGLFGSPKRAKWLLRRFYGMTSAKGHILAESRDIHDTNDPGHLSFHEQNKQRGRLAGQLRLRVRYKTLIGPWFDYLMVSPQEMADILKGTGWHMKDLIKSEGETLYTAVLKKI